MKTIREFLVQYANNLADIIDEGGYKLDDCRLQCAACPFKAECERTAEEGDNDRCDLFIERMLALNAKREGA